MNSEHRTDSNTKWNNKKRVNKEPSVDLELFAEWCARASDKRETYPSPSSTNGIFGIICCMGIGGNNGIGNGVVCEMSSSVSVISLFSDELV